MPPRPPGARRPSNASTWNRLAVRFRVPTAPPSRSVVPRWRAAARPPIGQSATRSRTGRAFEDFAVQSGATRLAPISGRRPYLTPRFGALPFAFTHFCEVQRLDLAAADTDAGFTP